MTLIILIFGLAFKIGLPVLAIVFLIKGIKYLNKKNAENHKD